MTVFPAPTLIDADGVRLALYEWDGDPARARAPVVLVHGWPDIAYAWSNTGPALADAGFRVIALDVKGFGRSDAPRDKARYDITHMTGDLVAMLDALAIERAVFCGHDWGGALVWPMAQLHGARVAGVIGVCTPHRPPPPVAPLTIIEKRYTERHYFIRFQEEGVAEALFESDPERFFRMMFRTPKYKAAPASIDNRVYDLVGRFRDGPPPDRGAQLLSDDHIGVYVDAYRRSGFHGGINLYRNIDRNWEIMRMRDPVIQHDALWIGGASDLFLPPDGADEMERYVPNLEKHVIADCGHWVMWERPGALNSLLVDWLLRKMPD